MPGALQLTPHLILILPSADPGLQHADTNRMGRAGEEGPRARPQGSQPGPVHRLVREVKLHEVGGGPELLQLLLLHLDGHRRCQTAGEFDLSNILSCE